MKRLLNRLKKSSGFSLVEVLVAMALLGVIGVSFLSGLGTASKTLLLTDVKQTARNIAEMQMETIKSQGWQLAYSPVTDDPDVAAKYPNFDIDVTADEFPRPPDTNIQRITIVVLHGGKEIYTLTSYKVKPRV